MNIIMSETQSSFKSRRTLGKQIKPGLEESVATYGNITDADFIIRHHVSYLFHLILEIISYVFLCGLTEHRSERFLD